MVFDLFRRRAPAVCQRSLTLPKGFAFRVRVDFFSSPSGVPVFVFRLDTVRLLVFSLARYVFDKYSVILVCLSICLSVCLWFWLCAHCIFCLVGPLHCFREIQRRSPSVFGIGCFWCVCVRSPVGSPYSFFNPLFSPFGLPAPLGVFEFVVFDCVACVGDFPS